MKLTHFRDSFFKEEAAAFYLVLFSSICFLCVFLMSELFYSRVSLSQIQFKHSVKVGVFCLLRQFLLTLLGCLGSINVGVCVHLLRSGSMVFISFSKQFLMNRCEKGFKQIKIMCKKDFQFSHRQNFKRLISSVREVIKGNILLHFFSVNKSF